MKTMIWIGLALTTLGLAEASAQETARARAQQELPSDVFAGIAALADERARDGIPAEPLFNKALEGLAKRVPTDRLMPAIQSYADRLGQARGAFGPTAAPPLLVAGADALQRGVDRDALQRLGEHERRSPMAVLVLADLLESGVASDRAIAVLRQAMDARTTDDRMLDIPIQLRRLMREGRTARDAIDQVRRSLPRDRGGRDIGPPVPPGSEPPTRDRPRRTRGGAA